MECWTAMPFSEAEFYVLEGFTPDECALCGHKEIVISSELFVLAEVDRHRRFTGSTSWPFVVMTCNSCGHIHLFDAGKLGVTMDKTAQRPPDPVFGRQHPEPPSGKPTLELGTGGGETLRSGTRARRDEEPPDSE